MPDRQWFECMYCNGNKKILWYEDVLDPIMDLEKPQIIDCPHCDGEGGWWILLEI